MSLSLLHWLQLSLTRGVGPILIRRIIGAAGGAEAACSASAVLLRNVDGIGQAKADAIRRGLREAGPEAEKELERAQKLGVSLLCPDDGEYPVLLRSIPDPPPVLYFRGKLEARDLNAVAIVGSRKCSMYGREQADRFGALLAGSGVTVISGGARGIDSAAHRGALTHPQGRTAAVLGSGVDVAYPPENEPLFRQIAESGRGAVMSEFPLGTPPVAENFPRRNRIVSGMSRGVLVIEADERSGALITARQACDDHGRPVFALPGRVDNALSAGPHQLIRDGAVLAAKLEDILDNLGPLPQEAMEGIALTEPGNGEDATGARLTTESPAPQNVGASAAGLSDRQQVIVASLDEQPADVDAIIDRTSLSAQEVLQELTFLSLRGQVRRVDGQTYARRKN
jgi:DNA processing protein